MTKGIRARDDRNVTKRAADAESEWRRSSAAAAALPSAEIRGTRGERRAKLEYQRTHGNEASKHAADELRRRERDNDAERERTRNRRNRPHKHLPAGLVELPSTVESREGIEVVSPAEKETPGARIAIGLRTAGYDEMLSGVERVSPELAQAAEQLRGIFDVRSYDRETFSHPENAPRMLVRREVAEAIRAASDVVRTAWIGIAIERVTDAVVERERAARGGADMVGDEWMPRDPVEPAKVLRSIVRGCSPFGGLPDYVDEKLVEWMLVKLAVGVSRGGGRRAKMSAAKMRGLLADPTRLTTALRAAGPNSSRKRV